ncbi:HD domain-containing protein [bacterium]|nr:HD domain-containing protein [bacterium]
MDFIHWHHQVQPAIREWFEQYVRPFIDESPAVRKQMQLKYDHSYRVMQEMHKLARLMNLKTDEIAFAGILGLLHDIGRFEQYHRYRTFLDRISENHAALGVQILKKGNVFKAVPDDVRELIYFSISCHNVKSISDEIEGNFRFYSQMLRDADKLDIYYLITEYYRDPDPDIHDSIMLNLPDSPECSVEAVGELMSGNAVSSAHVRTQNDFKLLQMGWIYDVNYPETMLKIVQEKYLEKIRAALPDTAEMDRVYQRLTAYIDNYKS